MRVRRFAEDDGIAGYARSGRLQEGHGVFLSTPLSCSRCMADGEARPASMERESIKLSGVTHALGRL
jgi:hypothetical protein